MNKICTDIVIDVPVKRVWDILTDFDRYVKWNSFITSIHGDLNPGSRLAVHMQPPGTKGMDFNPVITKVEPVNEFRWVGNLWVKGIFDGEHAFRLEELENSRTRLIHCERFRGILAPLILSLIGKKIKEGFENMNNELKEESEKSNDQKLKQNVPLA